MIDIDIDIYLILVNIQYSSTSASGVQGSDLLPYILSILIHLPLSLLCEGTAKELHSDGLGAREN